MHPNCIFKFWEYFRNIKLVQITFSTTFLKHVLLNRLLLVWYCQSFAEDIFTEDFEAKQKIQESIFLFDLCLSKWLCLHDSGVGAATALELVQALDVLGCLFVAVGG